MKRFAKSVLGVTLLEIMLVLAIAAMIIVMSVRYYQSASINQQANAFIAQLNAIQAAADSLAQGTGSYSAAGVNSTAILAITGGGASGLNTPWGGKISVSAAAATMTYTVTLTPTAVCNLVKTRLNTNSHWSATAGSADPLTDCGVINYNTNT